jgi:predicted DNA-binding transcriptional regulator YafY
MLSDDEALAVLLGLVAGRRAGLTTADHTANETASAKIGRVLPKHIARRLDTLLEALAFTDQPGEFDTPDGRALAACRATRGAARLAASGTRLTRPTVRHRAPR